MAVVWVTTVTPPSTPAGWARAGAAGQQPRRVAGAAARQLLPVVMATVAAALVAPARPPPMLITTPSSVPLHRGRPWIAGGGRALPRLCAQLRLNVVVLAHHHTAARFGGRVWVWGWVCGVPARPSKHHCSNKACHCSAGISGCRPLPLSLLQPRRVALWRPPTVDRWKRLLWRSVCGCHQHTRSGTAIRHRPTSRNDLSDLAPATTESSHDGGRAIVARLWWRFEEASVTAPGRQHHRRVRRVVSSLPALAAVTAAAVPAAAVRHTHTPAGAAAAAAAGDSGGSRCHWVGAQISKHGQRSVADPQPEQQPRQQ